MVCRWKVLLAKRGGCVNQLCPLPLTIPSSGKRDLLNGKRILACRGPALERTRLLLASRYQSGDCCVTLSRRWSCGRGYAAGLMLATGDTPLVRLRNRARVDKTTAPEGGRRRARDFRANRNLTVVPGGRIDQDVRPLSGIGSSAYSRPTTDGRQCRRGCLLFGQCCHSNVRRSGLQ
jgi:hypothetical protein